MSDEALMSHDKTMPAGSRRFSFGVGCLQFLPAIPTVDMHLIKYCLDLDRFLRTIPAVGDIRVEPGFDSEAYWVEKTPTPGDNEYIWPETEVEIEMTLHIPSRVQDELKEGLSLETEAEDFSLLIRHGYYAPIAIVTADSDSHVSSGSSFVYLVREFLNRVLNEKRQDGFLLDTIGPSPFHADFAVYERSPSETADAPITVVQRVKPGYDDIIWYVDTRQTAFDKAIDEILEGVRYDADLFYEIIQRRNRLVRSWAKISVLAGDVIDMEQKRPLIQWMKEYPLKARAIKEAIMRVAEHQMLDIEQRSQLNSILRDHKWARHGGMKRFCEQEFENLEKFPAEELRDLLGFLENRVRHIDNVIIALLAAVIGGLAGGALAVLAA